jgi:ferritin-like metal-binding protein YciE
MHIGNYLALIHGSEQQLADALDTIAAHHGDEPDILQTCQLLATWSHLHLELLKPIVDRYSEDKNDEPERLSQTLFDEPRSGSLALLRDLHDLWLLAHEVQLCWTVLAQAAQALHDRELLATCQQCSVDTKRQISWLMTRIKQAAPQALVVAT